MGNQCGCCHGTNVGELKSEEPVKHIEMEEEDTIDVMKYPAEDHRPSPDFATIKINYEHVFTKPQKNQMQKQKPFKYTEDEPEDKRLPELPEYYQLNDGSIYKGTWFHGLPHGKGVFYCKDHIYEGYIRDAGYHGLGRMTLNNGDLYEGRYIEGEFEGKGKICYYDSGLELIGVFKGGFLDGEGRETWPNLTSYTGNYKNGKKDGKGKLVYGVKINKQKKKKKNNENEQEEAEEEENKKEINYVDEFYDGDWKDNFQHGTGIYQWVDGRRYEGKWEKGKMHGEGVFVWRDKKMYKGMYKNDTKHGKGTFYWADDVFWIGQWVNGKREGKGVFYLQDKKRIGFWENGRVVKWESPDPDKNQEMQGGEELDEAINNRGEFNQDLSKSPLLGSDAKTPEDSGKKQEDKTSPHKNMSRQASKHSSQAKPENAAQNQAVSQHSVKNSRNPSRKQSELDKNDKELINPIVSKQDSIKQSVEQSRQQSNIGYNESGHNSVKNSRNPSRKQSELDRIDNEPINPILSNQHSIKQSKVPSRQQSNIDDNENGQKKMEMYSNKESRTPSRKNSNAQNIGDPNPNIFAISNKNSEKNSKAQSRKESQSQIGMPEVNSKNSNNLMEFSPDKNQNGMDESVHNQNEILPYKKQDSNPDENAGNIRVLTDTERDILNDGEQIKF